MFSVPGSVLSVVQPVVLTRQWNRWTYSPCRVGVRHNGGLRLRFVHHIQSVNQLYCVAVEHVLCSRQIMSVRLRAPSPAYLRSHTSLSPAYILVLYNQKNTQTFSYTAERWAVYLSLDSVVSCRRSSALSYEPC